MLNLSKYFPIVVKVLTNTSEPSLFIFKTCLKQKKIGVLRLTQVRWKSNSSPTPGQALKGPGFGPKGPDPKGFGMSPGLAPKGFEGKGIPLINPGSNRHKGRLIMMLIPFLTFGLGTWQIKRLKWKTELIERIQRKLSMDPVPLPTNPEEVADMEFQRVIVKGKFDHDNEIFYGPKPCFIDGKADRFVLSKDGQGSYGYNLITPFVLSDTGERILVNRGWLPTKDIKKERRPWSLTEEEETLTGVVRISEPLGVIVPSGDEKQNIWHFRDIEAMALDKRCLPIYIDLTEEHSVPKHLWAGQTVKTLRNEHLSYIITWYALSVATSVMWYVRYVKK